MSKEITIEEAKKTIKEWYDQDDFVCRNVNYYMYGGEPTDNSIELAQYWNKCKAILSKLKGDQS